MSGYEWMYVNGVRSFTVSGYRLCRPEVTVDPDDWAHGVWTAVAIMLAQPLRKVFGEHLATCEVCTTRAINQCPEGLTLWELLPDGDKVLIA